MMSPDMTALQVSTVPDAPAAATAVALVSSTGAGVWAGKPDAHEAANDDGFMPALIASIANNMSPRRKPRVPA
jgi:hypothetical protein